MKRRTRFLYVAGTVAASAAIVAWGGVASAANHAATVGQPPTDARRPNRHANGAAPRVHG
jgi:hypothetical protein